MGGILSSPPAQQAGPSTLTPKPRAVPVRSPSARSYLSYFLPAPTPELTHSHNCPAGPASINAVLHILTSKGLPLELAQRIIEDARYWSKCTRTNKRACTVLAQMDRPRQAMGSQLERWMSGQEEEVEWEREVPGSGLTDGRGKVWYLCSSPIGCRPPPSPSPVESSGEQGRDACAEEDQPVSQLREIIVETFSRDQGWSDNHPHYGTYEQSYSWFELSLVRDGLEVPNSRFRFQNNIHAGQYFKSHTNVFGREHHFVRMAEEGDRVVLWARAEFAGWSNHIKEATITVYSAPFKVR